MIISRRDSVVFLSVYMLLMSLALPIDGQINTACTPTTSSSYTAWSGGFSSYHSTLVGPLNRHRPNPNFMLSPTRRQWDPIICICRELDGFDFLWGFTTIDCGSDASWDHRYLNYEARMDLGTTLIGYDGWDNESLDSHNLEWDCYDYGSLGKQYDPLMETTW